MGHVICWRFGNEKGGQVMGTSANTGFTATLCFAQLGLAEFLLHRRRYVSYVKFGYPGRTFALDDRNEVTTQVQSSEVHGSNPVSSTGQL